MGVPIGLDRLLAELTPEQARSVLLRLAEELDTDLTPEGVDDFYDEMIALEVDDDALLDVTVREQRQEIPLLVEFFRHDTGPDELLVVAPPQIVAHAQSVIERQAPGAKLHVIPGS
jgi:hypothetical protein